MSLFERRAVDPRVAADPHRLPPGQVLTQKWPVLQYSAVPHYSTDEMAAWRLRITGAVEKPFELTYDELRAMPSTDVVCDIHCVTTWSRFDNRFTGIPLQTLMDAAGVRPDATHVVFRCASRFTTSIPLDVVLNEGAAVVYAHDGADLTPEHGWPLRALVPSRYFWKSAKWLEGLDFVTADELGFWERNGYNNAADPWQEERYW